MDTTQPSPKPTLTPLQQAALALRDARQQLEGFKRSQSEPIAIVGMACRFPGGSDSPEAYWRMICDATDAVGEIPADRWNVDEFFDAEPGVQGKTYSRWGGFLPSVDTFDAEFFGISPREAAYLDPQQRLMLEVAWEALEAAGQQPARLAGTQTGVFVGACSMDWVMMQTQSPVDMDGYLGTGGAVSILASRLSYLLDLRGPCLTMDTACSSSLVAVHLACQSLRRRESNLALAAGVNLMLWPTVTITLAQARMLSPTGRCHTFDAKADGYVRGEGCGMVVLKRLSDAVAAGDRILAVIRGTASNQDGKSNGLTAPNGQAQEQVIRAALADAGLEPHAIGYVEAHGTGTSLGDPVEVEALWQALGAGRDANHPLMVGSVKANIGHLEGAAGIAGLIKTALCLKGSKVPPNAKLKSLNPLLAAQGRHLQFPTELRPWLANGQPNRAGVSSFGFGGTNVHVILEQAPTANVAPSEIERPCHVVALSAKSDAALADLVDGYRQHLVAHPENSLADVAFTCNTGRSPWNERLAIVARSTEELRTKLDAVKEGREEAGIVRGRKTTKAAPPVVFLFTGQGSQYVGMGRELYETSPVFRDALNRCQEWLRPYRERPLLEVLYPAEGQSSPLDQTEYTQPALFALQYALVELWKSWGVTPSVVLGHSVGEFAAACCAGVMSPEDGLKFIAERGRLMQSLPAGGVMVAVFASETQVRDAIGPDAAQVAVATLNGPSNIVISGPEAAVQSVLSRLPGVKSQKLATSHAFHSPLMEPILGDLERVAASISLRDPSIELISNLTGRPVEKGAMSAASYWRRHAREAVNFEASVRYLAEKKHAIFVEIGPSPTLLGMARRCWPDDAGAWLPSLRAKQNDWQVLLESLGTLYCQGCNVDWAGFDRVYRRTRVGMPPYPFQRSRHWHEPSRTLGASSAAARQSEHELENWVYEVEWAPAEREGELTTTPGRWLVLGGETGLAVSLTQRLAALGQTCIRVDAAENFEQVDPEHFRVNPAELDQIQQLIAQVGESGLTGVVHLWAADAAPAQTDDELWAGQDRGSRAVLNVARALTESAKPAHLWLVTRGAQMVAERIGPAAVQQSPLWGMGKSLGLERPETWGGMIDLDPQDPSHKVDADVLAAELLSTRAEDEVAFRDRRRYVARLSRVQLPDAQPLKIRSDGMYLITGGLGGLGLEVADMLVRQGARHLGLMGRRGLPASGPAADAVRELQARGVRVVAVAADAANAGQLAAARQLLEKDGPPLRGIVHAAGVAGYRPLIELDSKELDELLRPKLLGGWNLHQLTAADQLDFFICFSSISAVWGSAQQVHYSAANACLDALAAWRKTQGHVALSIAWGPWRDVGMMPEEGRLTLDRLGVSSMRPAEGLAVMSRLMTGGPVNAVAAKVDWSIFAPVYEAKSRRRLFQKLTAEPEPEHPADRKAARRGHAMGDLLPQLEQMAAREHPDFVLAYVRKLAGRILHYDADKLPNPQLSAKDLGFDSLLAVQFAKQLGAGIGKKLPATLLFEHPTLDDVANFVCRQVIAVAATGAAAKSELGGAAEPIAIVGIACRLPGRVKDGASYWKLLCDGVDAIREVPPERWDIDAFYDPNPDAPGKMNTRFGGFLERIQDFDAAFFGISPQEAARMDPQQRLLLELCWESLEDAGLPPATLRGAPVGVYVGISMSEYGMQLNSDRFEAHAFTPTGAATSIAANRVSYAFDFRGPSLSVDTACSSSLVAVHLACQSLRTGESRLAVAGGVNLLLSPHINVNLTKGGFLAPDGRCRTFDAKASGYVRSEGASLVVLKPLSAAQADGDRIYAIIPGSAVNQDGRSNGLTAPNPQAQEAVLREAYAKANVAPGSVRYIEAHGTGTPLGDPMEVRALANVLSTDRPAGRVCAIGAAKTNVGHTEAAAGATGLIKVALCLHHRQLPPTVHYQTPNPNIPFDETPFKVQQTLGPWPEGDGPLIAGVSSFGFGGTNAHVVLTEAPKSPEWAASAPSKEIHLLPLSARSEEALEAHARSVREFLAAHASDPAALADIVHTASVRRDHHEFRLAIVTQSTEHAIATLDAFSRGENRPGMSSGRKTPGRRSKLAFVFSGQGPQWWGMGRQLLAAEPVFREVVTRCDEIIKAQGSDWSLLEEMRTEESRTRLTTTEIAQPALFALQVGLTALWRSWGIVPDAVVGHSLGEIAAAHVAGAITLEDGVRISYLRGRLMQRAAGPGRMAAIELPAAEVLRALTGHEASVGIAAINSPNAVTISGDRAAIETLVESFRQRGVQASMLHVDCAFHSSHMEPARRELEQTLAGLHLKPVEVPLFSTVTGHESSGMDLDATHWGRNVREHVNFAEAIGRLIDKHHDVFLEIGPHPTLSGAIGQCLRHRDREATVLSSLRRNDHEPTMMLRALAALYARGYAVDWRRLSPAGKCVRLPSYPWQHEEHWIEPIAAPKCGPSCGSHGTSAASHPLLGRHLKLAHPPGCQVWEFELNAKNLAGHECTEFDGNLLVPGAVFVERAAAAAQIFDAEMGALADIDFPEPLFVPSDGSVSLQVILTPAARGEATFDIYGRLDEPDAADPTWILHATGRARRGKDGKSEHAARPGLERGSPLRSL